MSAKRYPIQKGFILFLASAGLDADKILSELNVADGELSQSNLDVLLTEAEFMRLFEIIDQHSQHLPIPPPLLLPEVFPVRYLEGLLSLASYSPNLGEGIEYIKKAIPLLGPVTIDVFYEREIVRVRINHSPPNLALNDFMQGMGIVTFVWLMRIFSHTFITPLWVQTPGEVKRKDLYEKFLGAQIFHGEHFEVCLHKQDLELKFDSGDCWKWDDILALVDNLVEKQNSAPNCVVSIVKKHIEELLCQRKAYLNYVAERMAISPRTLQSKLNEQNTSFQLLLKEVRLTLAHRFLVEEKLTPKQTANKIGFSETPSFYRAFTGWTGKTPKQYQDSFVSANNTPN